VHPAEFLVYGLLGVVGGLVSAAFVKLLLWQRKQFLSMPNATKWLQPAVGGLVVGLLALYRPEVLGVGYSFVDQALNGRMVIATMAILVVLKIAATSTCYASGNAGGIFGPSLFMGAMMGGSVGGVAHMLFPDYTGSVGAYALVGMGAAFAGIIRVPLTSVIMIFEITRDYTIIVPLMIANLMSYFISSRLQEEPVYEALQHQDGIHLPSGARARDTFITVGNGFRTDAQVLSASMSLSQAAAAVDQEQGVWAVSDAQGLRGMVTLEQLTNAAKENGDGLLSDLVPNPGPIELLTEAKFPHVHPDHPLDVAMRRIAQTKLASLPVVSRTNVRDLKGVISLRDILDTYALGSTEQASGDIAKLPVRLFAGVLAAVLSLAILGGLLNYFYRTQRSDRAQHYFEEGNSLMEKERYEEAISQYRLALSISHNVNNRLTLGQALVTAKHPREATIYLDQVLKNQSEAARMLNGSANLGLARAEVQQGEIDEAVVYYQHAIDGAWPDRPAENRFQAQIELVQTLQKAGRHSQARAELLSIAAAPPDIPALRKQLGRMLLDDGMAKEAIGVFTNVLQRNQQDSGAYNGLGDAEFANQDYARAREAYGRSLAIAPTDERARKRADLCDRILALDPRLPGVESALRYQRSKQLLSAALEEWQRCAGGTDTTANAASSGKVEQAKKAIAQRGRPQAYASSAEANTALAQQLWAARPAACASAGEGDELLSRIMTLLQQ
jgi:tetratricopeptide (TPR) repeat protein/CBS domain-containing protein